MKSPVAGHAFWGRLIDDWIAGLANELSDDMALAEWRVAREKTHAQMPKALRVGQPAGATPDNRDGMNASNLRRCIEALGGTLEIAARVPDGVVVKRFEEKWGRKLVRSK